MPEYNSILTAATQLSLTDRLRLIDDLAATFPDDQPPTLSEDWLNEIELRSSEVDDGKIATQSWQDVKQRLNRKYGDSSEG